MLTVFDRGYQVLIGSPRGDMPQRYGDRSSDFVRFAHPNKLGFGMQRSKSWRVLRPAADEKPLWNRRICGPAPGSHFAAKSLYR
jgi:hypothetical protein